MTGNERKQPEGNQFCHQDQSQKILCSFAFLKCPRGLGLTQSRPDFLAGALQSPTGIAP